MTLSYLILLLACLAGTHATRDWRVQRLNQFQQHYNNSAADIIFLLDVSGSVSDKGFNTEKEFIKSVLSQISVQPVASRVSVITFGKNVKKEIDYIDYGLLDKDKCSFTREFARVTHRKGPATNMKGSLVAAQSILDEATKHGFKRQHVNTVIFMLTDGQFNYGGSPYTLAGILRDRSKYDAEIFSVGVGWVSEYQLKKIAGTDSNVIIARDFSEFKSIATRIRGGKFLKFIK